MQDQMSEDLGRSKMGEHKKKSGVSMVDEQKMLEEEAVKMRNLELNEENQKLKLEKKVLEARLKRAEMEEGTRELENVLHDPKEVETMELALESKESRIKELESEMEMLEMDNSSLKKQLQQQVRGDELTRGSKSRKRWRSRT